MEGAKAHKRDSFGMFFFKTPTKSSSCEVPHRFNLALYQGTTLVVPQLLETMTGFSP
jgi:hypothetical protein